MFFEQLKCCGYKIEIEITHTDRTRRKYVQKFNFVVEQLVQLEKFECEKQKERFDD